MKSVISIVSLVAFTIGLAPRFVFAQGNEQLLSTIGTTVVKDGRSHAYVLWQPGAAAATRERRFAVYARPGTASAPGEFTRQGIQTLQSSPLTIRSVLELGAKVDRADGMLPGRIDALFRDITLNPGGEPANAPDPNLDAAGKLDFLIQSAARSNTTLSRLFMLGRTHPGVMLALGHAFVQPIGHGPRTYEVRELDNNDQDLRVVGRVTLDAAIPTVIPPPGQPVQVFHPVTPGSQFPVSPRDHLNARLRWGVDEPLLLQIGYTAGYDLFRVKKAAAEAKGWHNTPPEAEDMLAELASSDPTDSDPDVAVANDLPIFTAKTLTLAEAANTNDRDTFDFADDKVRFRGASGSRESRRFVDGESFYYFVAARDIAGFPGYLSPGTLVRMCDRLPPNPPELISVFSNFVNPEDPAEWEQDGAGDQFLRIRWRQLPESPDEGASVYHIYRWSSPDQYLSNLGNPETNLVGMVEHLPGETFGSFDDSGEGAPSLATHQDKAVWYTMRAASNSACEGEVLSGHGAPMAGVLRDFTAPPKPFGTVEILRRIPRALFVSRDTHVNPEAQGAPGEFGNRGMTVKCEKTDPDVVAVQVRVDQRQSDGGVRTVYARRHDFGTSDHVSVHLPQQEVPAVGGVAGTFIVVTTVGANGLAEQGFSASPNLLATVQPNYVLYRFTCDMLEVRIDADAILEDPVIHESSGVDGIVAPIEGILGFPLGAGVREWRVYRRVGDGGELTLVAKAEGENLPNPGEWMDTNMPSAPGTSICYYGQLFDQNANPGPLTLLACVTTANPALGMPVLAPAVILPAEGHIFKQLRRPVRLKWFCDPAGVDRFQVLVSVEGGGNTGIGGLRLAPIYTHFPESSQVYVEEGVPITLSLPGFEGRSFYFYQTDPVPPGEGPSFEQVIYVPADKEVSFAVRAVGPGAPPVSGRASNLVSCRWRLTAPPEPDDLVPWPAFPLPSSYRNDRPYDEYMRGEGPFIPLTNPTLKAPTVFLVGLTRGDITSHSSGSPAVLQPNIGIPDTKLFGLRTREEDVSAPLEKLLPFMLFRYQIPSEAFPAAKANVVQCTPLLERISYVPGTLGGITGNIVDDPYFGFLSDTGSGITIGLAPSGAAASEGAGGSGGSTPQNNDSPPLPAFAADMTGYVFVRDILPVTAGAKYQHVMVCYNARGEIRRVIKLPAVQH